jgi:Bacteriophage head to tail connecting protein
MATTSIKLSNFYTVRTGGSLPSELEEAVEAFLCSRHTYFKDARMSAEENWLEAWSLYTGTPEAIDHQRTQTIHSVGDVNNDWRHRLNTGKTYEAVETVHGYLMSALFPNEQWFDLKPTRPGYLPEARVIKSYVSWKLRQGKFNTVFEKYLRQLLITGFSVMATPWRYETKPHKYNVTIEVDDEEYFAKYGEKKRGTKTVVQERVTRNSPEFECLSCFDVYIDPNAIDPNNSDLIRRVKKTRADIISCIESGKYTGIEPLDVVQLPSFIPSDRSTKLKQFQGMQVENSFCMDDIIEVIEYWGDIHLDGVSIYDVCAVTIAGELVSIEPNPFWAGKPFVIGTVTELTESPYSMGLVQPNMGLIHQLNIITNQRCDNLELVIDQGYTLKQNSVLQPDEVQMRPGAVFLVEEHDDLRPIPRDGYNVTVSYQEAGLLENTIDKNIGTGSLISANSARSGERVTAAEIQATRDAGGNRLSNVHRHIEQTSLIEILKRVMRSSQQFVKEPEMVRVSGLKPGTTMFVEVDAESLNKEYEIEPEGANYITRRTKFIRDRQEFLAFAASIPQMAQRINYDALLMDVVNNSGFDDPMAYVLPAAPQQPPVTPEQQLPPSPEQQEPTDPMYDIGGVSLQGAIQSNIEADGGASLIENATGVDINNGIQ